MSLSSTLKFLVNHPLSKSNPLGALWRFGTWQLRSRFLTQPIAFNWVEGTKLWMKKGWTGITGNYYTGLHEFQDMAFLLHLLRPGDTFADVGANMGTYTILASGVCGAKSFSFEPVEFTYNRLVANIQLNHLENLTTPIQAAVGSQAGEAQFTFQEDTTNHIATASETNVVTIPVVTLDDSIKESLTLLKVDVEGFESEVIKGASQHLADQALKAIIIELNGSGGRYGFNDQDIHNHLLSIGFVAYSYDPFKRLLQVQNSYGSHNTIYVRDLPWVELRLKEGKKRSVLDLSF